MPVEKIKVAVNVQVLSCPLTGVGRSVLELCRALCKIEQVSLYLYSYNTISPQIISALDKATVIRSANGYNRIVLRYLWEIIILPLWAKRDKVDIFWGPAHRLPLLLSKTILKILTVHDLSFKYVAQTICPHRRLFLYIYMPIVIRQADWIMAVSEATADSIKEAYPFCEKQVAVIPLGVTISRQDKTLPSVLDRFGIDRPFFLFVSTLEPRKNLLRLLVAYSRLSASLRNQTMFIVVGMQGWDKKINIKETIVKLDLLNHVRWLEYVDDQILSSLYEHAQFLAMPSLHEGFGLPLIEAMAYGKPVLTSGNSSMLEVAGEAGLFIDPLSTYSIQKGLERMISDHEFRNKLALHAKNNALKYNWDVSAQKLASLFSRACIKKKQVIS